MSSNTQYEVKIVLFGQFRPTVDDVAIVLWWSSQASAVVDTVVVEKDAITFVSIF
jgi:hypothetical protein